ncbi:MAG: glycine cleavage system protein T [Rhodobacteraceae bacterium]|nr:glycine cleavage system protein T [Paracoccaceae bacterium]
MNVAIHPSSTLETAAAGRTNPLSMNLPPYFTIPADSGLVSGEQPCLKPKKHLMDIIELVAARYGPHHGLRVLAGNVIGAGGWSRLPTKRQHDYVNARAGAFIASGMMYLEVSGPQALDVLDHLTPRNLRSLKTGRAAFTLFTTPTGTVDEEALVLRVEENRYLVSCGGGAPPSHLHEALERFPDARVVDSDVVSFNIKGPDRIAVMRDLVCAADRAAVDALKPFQACRCRTNAGDDVTVVRSVIGMEMWGMPGAITAVWTAMLDMPDRVLPCGWDLLDTYRIECTDIDFLLHPLDMNYGTTLAEIGLGWMVDPAKTADYVGREALREPAAGPRIKVRKLAVAGDRSSRPRIGEAVQDADGRIRGHVSSCGYSYAADRHVAFVHLADDGSDGPLELKGWTSFQPGVRAAG